MNSKKQNLKATCHMSHVTCSGGFTLIELLIVVAIIASIVAIAVGIVSSTLRGTNKTNVINKVRENGNYAISQMARTIKYAKSFAGASTTGGLPWDCQVVPPGPPPPPIQYKYVRLILFDDTTTTFACETNTISSNTDSLIDAGPSGSVELSSPGACFFTCSQESTTASPTIGINFTLKSKTTSSLLEHQASIPFSTSVKMRN